MMLSVRRNTDGIEVPEGDNQVVVAADKDGYLNIYRRATSGTACEWAHLSETQYEIGQWVRVSLYMDYENAAGASVLVKLDGEESEISGTAANGVSGTIWTSTAPISGEKAFYKVKVVPDR